MTAAVTSLAEDLAAALIDGVGGPGEVARVDDAMADALEAIEALLVRSPSDEAVRAAASLAIDLVLELRHGRLDRTACRVAGPVVTERLVRAAGESSIDVLAPALILLAALAVVPDGPGITSSATDPTPDPDLPLEVALAAAVADPSRRTELLDVLAAATVHVPVLHAEVQESDLALRLVPLVLRDGPVACAFTSAARFEEVAAEAGCPVPTVALTGAELVELWPAGHGLALNPGSVLGAVLSERDVRSLGSRLRGRTR